MKKKAGVAIIILDKIHFKTKAVIRDKEGHYIHNTKGTDPTRGYNPCKHICTQYRST